jgi:hypothetical protein
MSSRNLGKDARAAAARFPNALGYCGDQLRNQIAVAE